jgi:tetrahydromethanopterin S-methyltransferase subunit D
MRIRWVNLLGLWCVLCMGYFVPNTQAEACQIDGTITTEHLPKPSFTNHHVLHRLSTTVLRCVSNLSHPLLATWLCQL